MVGRAALPHRNGRDIRSLNCLIKMGRSSRDVLVLATALVCCCLAAPAEDVVPLGCFTEDADSPRFMYHSPDAASGTSVNACVEECQSKVMRYAALFDGDKCLCGDTLSGTPSELCSTPCSANSTQNCGGAGVMSVYEIGPGILGAPESLTQVDSRPSSLRINWEPPAAGLSEILEYHVTAIPVFTYSERDSPRPMKWVFSAHTHSAWLNSVQAGTKYLVEVAAASSTGLGYRRSMEMWTRVGKPEIPASPQLLSQTSTTMTVQLESVTPTNGPIVAYQVVVIDGSVELQPALLEDYSGATEKGLPFYIAAQFSPDNFVTTFTVGDRKRYGKYYNAPLKGGSDYHILLGVLSTINETTASYSSSNHEQHESAVLDGRAATASKDAETSVLLANNQKVILGLSIAIGLFGFLLVVSFFVYIALRVVVRKNRRSSDNQELAVNALQPNQDVENGYVVGAHYVDEETPPADHYRLLKEKVWIIPHQGLNIVGDIGTGKFGDVRKGVIISKGNQKNVMIQRIEDDTLDRNRKTRMLREFDAHIRIGSHPHIVSLLGLMEELNIISVAFEYETATLKTQLTESRAVQHYPVYAEKNRRFSTLPESQALNVLVGVARGLNYLASLGVVHGQLCARNVVLVDGTRPKVSGFGLLHYHNDLQVPDYRRWYAVETFRSKVSVPKSDVWSFGCLMWEVTTLGGTPYADVRNEEVAGRVIRGLRLPQPQYVGDELYQLMLNCWQQDLDERPAFSELEDILRILASDDVIPHLLFSLYPSFQYEQYVPLFEFID